MILIGYLYISDRQIMVQPWLSQPFNIPIHHAANMVKKKVYIFLDINYLLLRDNIVQCTIHNCLYVHEGQKQSKIDFMRERVKKIAKERSTFNMCTCII